MWNGSKWYSLGNSGVLGMNAQVFAIAIDFVSNRVFVGGVNIQAPFGNIAMWNGTNWNSLQNGINGQVKTLAFDSNSNRLYVAGSFSQADSIVNASNIAMWDGSNWNSLQFEAPNSLQVGVPNNVLQIFYDSNKHLLYVTLWISPMQIWDGASWSSFFSSPYVPGSVSALVFNPNSNQLYVGVGIGIFDHLAIPFAV